MPKVLEPGWVDLRTAIDDVASVLFPDVWQSNTFAKERPFYLRRKDRGEGRRWYRVRRKLVGPRTARKLEYVYLKISSRKEKDARDVAVMRRQSFNRLIALASGQPAPTIGLFHLNGSSSSISEIPSGIWWRTIHTILCTGYVLIDASGEYSRVVVSQAWLDSVKPRLPSQTNNSLQQDTAASPLVTPSTATSPVESSSVVPLPQAAEKPKRMNETTAKAFIEEHFGEFYKENGRWPGCLQVERKASDLNYQGYRRFIRAGLKMLYGSRKRGRPKRAKASRG
jgi:hypothetical protein